MTDTKNTTHPELKEGESAPDFHMEASGARTVSLAGLKSKPFVLYFYPKADTPGCTKEACGFSEALEQFEGVGLTVIGVSRDPVKKLDKFAEKYDLTFPLASDEAGVVTEAYGVWVEKSLYGKIHMGIDRTTFLIGADGKIAHIWKKVKVPGHVEAVLDAAKALRT
ncbi:thioredoxin-dependent thiol peroxidase [Acetobacter orleanensis]|uniref:thioredoxin-dependent peroxiredoxin n=1 Tax=Acetobacter orleanensis TaxID=104099 RepID=A0A4Y3TM75_9PROT|nr:thioredoxin-dependent thiol peroxidase [Acetobacter orleanensis]KXV62201.1 bacterioferritin [Acetobacter orleanensis]PCD80548.1 thioredoxin-dependent thiol peroxidase [Acetobacter orleanensis]GAN68151.1 thioredoxin peroxidase [Acetobacter orleanensis JCM 7639]GBR26894.1 thioredoxin peroxidase [Acetobacter orleanensis NRIC 0473]GEB81925.1 peroxiredoxin [Acetobacter orleanensis]